MKNLNLTTTTQGVKGGKNKHLENGYSLLSVQKHGTHVAQISVDTFEALGTGKGFKERENPHIEIYFPGFYIWKGTPEELKKALGVKEIL